MGNYYKLTLIWAAFYILHSLLADRKVKAWASSILGDSFRFYRIGYNILNVCFSCFAIMYHISLPARHIYTVGHTAILLGVLFVTFGIGILFLAIRSFNNYEFIGLEQLKKREIGNNLPRLTTTGFYSIVRHPLYFGLFTLMLGYLILNPTIPNLIFGFITILYLPIGIYLEERKLVDEFGDEYRKYRKKVKALIPYIL